MKSRRLTWVLAVIVVAIWGTIARQFYTGVADGEPGGPATVQPVDLTRLRSDETYVYRDDVRDPFQPSLSAVKHEPARIKLAPSSSTWVAPPLKLAGIISTGKQRTVVLEGPDGTTFLAKEGDTLQGLKVIKVNGKIVSYLYNSKKADWNLPEDF